ncbi:MAG: hypothetical protein QOE70_4695 [Chthoniobacter sp.]|jgi:filamentous hemagglutinin family protein|nr:hypothetical protein [Chthoniobacter sp.]
MNGVMALCFTAWALQAGLSAWATDVRFDGSVRKTVPPPLTGSGNIPGDAGEARGPNLFYSFSAFSVSRNDTVTFLPQAGVQTKNVLARVTTKNTPSVIDGTIKSAIPGANFYLLNPSGVIFSGNAKLEISGSFFASTADHINLGPSGKFAAEMQPLGTGLTLDPSGFGFNSALPKGEDANPPELKLAHGEIRVEDANLGGEAGTTLGLVGRKVSIKNSRLDVKRGEVQLASLTKGTWEASMLDGRTSSSLASHSLGGSIALDGVFISDFGAADQETGLRRVVIRGGTLALNSSTIAARAEQSGDGIYIRLQRDLTVASSGLFSKVFGDFPKQPVLGVTAHSASINDGAFLFAGPFASGRGGDLRLTLSGRLVVRSGGSIQAVNQGSSMSGGLLVRARSAEINAGSTGATNPKGSRPGKFSVAVKEDLTLRNGGELTLTSPGGKMEVEAGVLTLRGDSAISFNNSLAGDPGAKLDIHVHDRLSVSDGAQISATTIGQAGRKISIEAGEVFFSGLGANRKAITGIIDSSTGPAGSRGGQIKLKVSGDLQVLDGATIASNTLGPGSGGNILIEADEVVVTGRRNTPGTFEVPRGITAQNQSGIGGPSGNIKLDVRRLQVRDGGEVDASTEGSGRGGNILVNGDEIYVSRGGRLVAETFGTDPRGLGGDIFLNLSGRLQVNAGGSVSVSTRGAAPGGNLGVHSGSVLIEGAGAEVAARSGTNTIRADGTGGNIHVNTDHLEIAEAGQLTASTFGLAPGGNVRVEADQLFIRQQEAGAGTTGISAQTLGIGRSGPGGQVHLEVNEAALNGAGATVTTSSSGSGSAGAIDFQSGEMALLHGSSIQSSSTAAGFSGTVRVGGDREISLRGGSSISVAAATSSAGDLHLHAGESVRLEDSNITAQAALNGGNVSLQATDLRLEDSDITAQAALTGGNLSLRARDLLFLRDSRITAAAKLNGGNIAIDPRLVVLDHSLIDARAVLASGGNIHITSDNFLTSPASMVTATSERGIDGDVQIDALNIDLTGSLVELPAVLLDAESLLRELCTMKLDDFSSFVRQGRGGMPPLPRGPLPSLEILP